MVMVKTQRKPTLNLLWAQVSDRRGFVCKAGPLARKAAAGPCVRRRRTLERTPQGERMSLLGRRAPEAKAQSMLHSA